MISKQLLLGLGLVLGGSVILYAVSSNDKESTQATTSGVNTTTTTHVNTSQADDIARPEVQPITADIQTEAHILEQKQQEREARALAQENAAKALIAEQERATDLAIKKAAAEAEERRRLQELRDTPDDGLSVQTRPEAVAALREAERREAQKKREEEARLKAEQEKIKTDEENKAKAKAEQAKAKANKEKEKIEKSKNEQAKKDKAEQVESKTTKSGQHKVVRGDNLIRLSRQYGIPVSAIAEANNMGRNDALHAGKVLKIPSASEVQKLQRQATEREAKKVAAATADKRLKEARQEAKKSSSNNHYSVQVAMASNQAKADEVAAQYKAAGYSVSTSQTSRGVRVLVGSERSQDAANALKDKLAGDGRVKTNGAFVKRID